MDELIDTFLHRLAVEKGYSENTLRAYATDLCAFAEFLSGRGRTLTAADVRDVRGFLAYLQTKKIARSTIARRTAAVRSSTSSSFATASRRPTPCPPCAPRAASAGCRTS